jgi:hypothetical protein
MVVEQVERESSAFAKAACELPLAAVADDSNNVEIKALGRITGRDELDLAKKPVAGSLTWIVVAFGLQHPQANVMKAIAGRRSEFICGLNGRHIRTGLAGKADQRAGPEKDAELQHPSPLPLIFLYRYTVTTTYRCFNKKCHPSGGVYGVLRRQRCT